MPAELTLTLVAVFVSVALISATAASLVFGWGSTERRTLRRKLAPAGTSSAGVGRLDVRLTDAPTTLEQRLRRIVPKSPKQMSRLRRMLATAGYHSTLAATIYAASELLLPVALALAVFLVRGLSRGGSLFVAIAAAVGYFLPSLWLSRKTAARQKQISNGLPDALDLFIVCIEAGSSIDQAILKSSEELAISYPALAEELTFVINETRAGKPRVEAFKNFAARTKVDDVRALSAMLVQTDRFGTSVAQALRTHAETARTKRRQRAEERAGKIGVKLVFPLVFCLFPALYVVILGPAVIQYIRVFKTQLLP
jgi:tight adherence protein C